MTNTDMVYVLKIEYVPKINIFGLKMMVTSGLEKFILKSLHAGRRWFLLLNLKFLAKIFPLISKEK